jgi:phage FluMu gp28-like protein
MDYWFSSADESAAREYIEYCEFWAKKLFARIVKHYIDQIEDRETKQPATAFCIRCPNDRRITAMTSSPRRFRSKGGDVGLDEYAYHDDPRAMYAAANPVTMRGGWMRVFSTHNGEESQFNAFVKMARRILTALGLDPNRPPVDLDYRKIKAAARELKVIPWKLHRVTLLDAVEAGLVENINAFSGTNFSRGEFVADCLARCVDDDMRNQEYMCVPSVGTAALLTYELIEQCESDDCPAPLDGNIAPETLAAIAANGGPCYIGMDIGQIKDPTVIWLDQLVGDVMVSRAVKWMHQAPFRAQLDVYRSWMKATDARKSCIDAGGIGAMLAQEAAREFGESRVEQVRFTLPMKEELAMPVRRAFEDRTVRIPADVRIREDLHKIRKTQTAGGALRFDAERDGDGHADAFWAKALCQRARGTGGAGGWDGSGLVSVKQATHMNPNPDRPDDEDDERGRRFAAGNRRGLSQVGTW